MDQETISEEQTLETAEDSVQETETQSTEPEVDVNALEEKNRQLFERAKKAETELKRLRARPEATTDLTSTEQSYPTDINERLERQELMIKGYKDDEVDFLMQNGGKTALNNKLVLNAIKTLRQETKSQQATPSGTGKSPIYQKYSEAELKKMPADKLEELLTNE